MKVTLLGCGAGWCARDRSCRVGACDPNDARNRRQRCAVLVETGKTTVLVDAGPDIRNQLLPLGLKKIDAI